VLGLFNDVWKYEDDILKETLPTENDNNNEKDGIEDVLTINIHASYSIHIFGKVKGRSIELTSIDVVIDGIVEALNN
jgi:hypothetical protein